MKLHTDFRDYYDAAVGYGVDDKVHYNRFAKEAEIRLRSPFDFPSFENAGLLGFCGAIYPFIEIRKYNHRTGCYDYDSENLEVVERFFAYSFEEYKRRMDEWVNYTDAVYIDHSRRLKLKHFFIDWNYQDDAPFIEHKVPVWAVKLSRPSNLGLLNPRLKDYGFDRLKDAYAAFQEISVYLANILVEQKETAKIEDKFRIEQHGFDSKKSFRKEKKF